MEPRELGELFKDKLALPYSPVGFYFADKPPEDATGFKKRGVGCILPLILESARGKTVAFDEDSPGSDCFAFHLGYRDSIIPGIQYFLSHGPLIGRKCERLVKTPKLAKKYLESMAFAEKSSGVAVFKPVEKFDETEKPEVVIFFANPDQLSALVFLLYFDAPEEEDRLVSRFASGCGSIVTIPLQYARRGEKKAVWGLHDITARLRLPKEIMSFAVPYTLFVEMGENIEESFVNNNTWRRIVERMG